jgi:hypothetical protein
MNVRVVIACTTRAAVNNAYAAFTDSTLGLAQAAAPSSSAQGYSATVSAGNVLLQMAELPAAVLRARQAMGRPSCSRLVGVEVCLICEICSFADHEVQSTFLYLKHAFLPEVRLGLG